MDKDDWIIASIVVFAIVFFSGMAFYENSEWNKFKEEHQCEVVGKRETQAVYGIGPDGKYSTHFVPAQTAWKCDDGITYWR